MIYCCPKYRHCLPYAIIVTKDGYNACDAYDRTKSVYYKVLQMSLN